jgi:hypothetical protein
MGKLRVGMMVFVLAAAMMWQTAGVAAAAEAQPKLTQVVYLTASVMCTCNLAKMKAGNRVVEESFSGSRKAILQSVDVSTDMMTAETYLRKFHLAFEDLPALLFLDAQGNLLWNAKGKLSSKEVLNKLNEFGT